MGPRIDLWVRERVSKEPSGRIWEYERVYVKKRIWTAFVWIEQDVEREGEKDCEYDYAWEKYVNR